MKIVLSFWNMDSINYVQEQVSRNYSEIKKQIKEVIGNTCDFLQASLSLWIDQANKHESRWWNAKYEKLHVSL